MIKQFVIVLMVSAALLPVASAEEAVFDPYGWNCSGWSECNGGQALQRCFYEDLNASSLQNRSCMMPIPVWEWSSGGGGGGGLNIITENMVITKGMRFVPDYGEVKDCEKVFANSTREQGECVWHHIDRNLDGIARNLTIIIFVLSLTALVMLIGLADRIRHTIKRGGKRK